MLVVDRLRRERACSFRALVADADSTLVIVARFLALLELFREAAIAFDQDEAARRADGPVDRPDEGEFGVGDEFDEFDEAPAPAADDQGEPT